MRDIPGSDVSRETLERLEVFASLLEKWNRSINLVAKSTIPEIWDRHIIDSAQLLQWDVVDHEKWIDLGSGGGLPGIVVATIAKETHPHLAVTLVESDQRKSAFLRTAVTTLDLNCDIKAVRAETLAPQNADILSARAFTSLDGILDLAARHLNSTGRLLLHKGRTFADEIAKARTHWTFDVVTKQSMTDNEAKMLEIRNLQRATI